MDSFNASHKASGWRSIGEFEEVFKLIYDDGSTTADKKRALLMMQAWKVRRAQDTPLGVLCTLPLLDVLVKDLEGETHDSSVINVLYQNAIMKFINFASSFDLGRFTMYETARKLDLDSFLIDLRHSIAHGKQSFNLEVLRNSCDICLRWIRSYYWDKEMGAILDVDIKELRFDATLEEKLDSVFPFFDLLAEFTFKNINTFEQLDESGEMASERWPTFRQYMANKKLVNFRQALNHFKTILLHTMGSKSVRQNPKTFFHAMLSKCDFFMSAYEFSLKKPLPNLVEAEIETDDEEEEVQMVTPAKRQRQSGAHNRSIVKLYQDIIWHIAKNDCLPLFLEMLLQIYCNRGERLSRRQSAHFWITITLRSYQYYQKYCEFTKSNSIDQTEVTSDTRNIYSYQLGADLNHVIIFVGAQILPSHLKYSREFLIHLMENLGTSEDDVSMCINFMPLVYLPLTEEQIEDMKKLMNIKSSTRRNAKSAPAAAAENDIIHTIKDLHPTKSSNGASDKQVIWKRADSQICWSSLPMGHEFMV